MPTAICFINKTKLTLSEIAPPSLPNPDDNDSFEPAFAALSLAAWNGNVGLPLVRGG